jgi:hypothetical protein
MTRERRVTVANEKDSDRKQYQSGQHDNSDKYIAISHFLILRNQLASGFVLATLNLSRSPVGN